MAQARRHVVEVGGPPWGQGPPDSLFVADSLSSQRTGPHAHRVASHDPLCIGGGGRRQNRPTADAKRTKEDDDAGAAVPLGKISHQAAGGTDQERGGTGWCPGRCDGGAERNGLVDSQPTKMGGPRRGVPSHRACVPGGSGGGPRRCGKDRPAASLTRGAATRGSINGSAAGREPDRAGSAGTRVCPPLIWHLLTRFRRCATPLSTLTRSPSARKVYGAQAASPAAAPVPAGRSLQTRKRGRARVERDEALHSRCMESRVADFETSLQVRLSVSSAFEHDMRAHAADHNTSSRKRGRTGALPVGKGPEGE